jgi:alpha-L-arabinofuranosidase
LDDTNSINEPNKVVPRAEKAGGAVTNFARAFSAFSVAVLRIKAQ